MNLAWFSNKSVEGNIFDDPPKPPASEPYKGPQRSLTSNFSTPHDTILAGIYERTTTTVDSPAGNDDAHFLQAEPLHDAYDGSIVGHVVPSNPALHPETRICQDPPSKRDEQLWKQLSKVLDLQAEIASRHIQMEGIGTRSGDGKGKGKGKGAKSQINIWEAMGSTEGIPSDAAHAVDEDEGVELGAEADEEKRNREREDEFAKLAHQFEGRKEGIIEIMDQLDQLSKALTMFHHLQAPRISFAADSSSSEKERLSPMTSISTIVPPTSSTTGPPVSHLIINKMDPGTQQHMIDSPLSSQSKFDHVEP
ncbi:hypothetical protein BDZ89DRAFT_1060113 [Hymenopellis radicata]|nr:hypothetical protein BDZ89DRAFT_1060113 [Hymenopellis radicata]